MARAFALPRPLASGSLTLWVCCALHLVNDAMFSLLFPLLPLIADELHLSLAEAGLVKTAFSTASSVLQVPAGLLAERWGEYALLVGGNAWVAVGLVGMGLTGAFAPLVVLAVLGGVGGSTQHPLAMTLVTRVAPASGGRGTVVGTLNFAGDLGKICAPLLVLLVAAPFGWRTALVGLGVFGLLFSLAIMRLPVGTRDKETARRRDGETAGQGDGEAGTARRRDGETAGQRDGGMERGREGERERRRDGETARGRDGGTAGQGDGEAEGEEAIEGVVLEAEGAGGWGIARPWRFGTFATVGVLDASTRAGALAFLPFLLVERGLDTTQVSLLFSLLFVGGALGKFACGPLADRFGTTVAVVATETVTSAALLLLPAAPLLAVPLLVAVFGVVLNGTSSALYAAVADFFPASRRSRGYGLYYTLALCGSSLSPLLYGLLGDRVGLAPLFVGIAGVNALTLPLIRFVRAR